MQWPRKPVESLDRHTFRPPFCPWQRCPSHTSRGLARFRRHGVYIRACDARVVPRFRCLDCRRTCSQQTFACTYYLKRPELLADIAAGINAGSANRQLARSLRCAPSTVTALSARLGRHSILLSALGLQNIGRIHEPIVYDDFESFVFSQDHPFGLGTIVGQDSWYVYGFENAPHRRSGRRSMRRRATRTGPEHRQTGPYRRAFTRVLDLLAPRIDPAHGLRLISDGHPAYRAALSAHPARDAFEHCTFPNPPRGPKGSPRSTKAQVRDREMFAVDLLHKIMRHTLSHHRRETIAFGRRLNALLERAFLMAAWRNFVKARTERRPDPTTPAMRLGLAAEPWSWSRVLAQRLFPWRVTVPEPWQAIYRRELITSVIGKNRRHQLVNAA